MSIIGKLIEMKYKRDVKKARNKFHKQLKLLREGKIDLGKTPIMGSTGEVRGSSEKDRERNKPE